MKILFIHNSAAPLYVNGVSTHIELLSRFLLENKHKVNIISLNKDSSEQHITEITHNKIKRYFLPCHESSLTDKKYMYTIEDYVNPSIGQPLIDLVKKIKPDIIHLHSIKVIGANAVKVLKENFPKIPIILTMHDYWWLSTWEFMLKPNGYPFRNQIIDKNEELKSIYFFEDFMKTKGLIPEKFIQERDNYLKSILEKVDKIICVSKSFCNDIESNIGFKNKLISIPVGVQFPKAEEIKYYKNRDLGNRINLGFVSGENVTKGSDACINAVKELSRKYPNRLQLHIYNHPQTKDKFIFNILRELRRILLPKTIEFHTRYSIENIDNEVFHKIDILLAPSVVKESYGLIVREALVRGIPVIATNAGGVKNIVRHNKNSILVNWCSNHDKQLEQELIQAIEPFIKDRNIYKEMQKEIFTTKIEMVDEQNSKILDLYTSLVKLT